MGGLGPAVALLASGTVLDDTELVRVACERARRAAVMPEDGPDLARGSAGRIRAFGWFAQATGDPDWLSAARTAADHLLATANRDETGCWWTAHEGATLGGRRRVGYLDGVAGIADGLLDLAVVPGGERYREAACDAMRWIVAQAVPTSDHDRGITWPVATGESAALLAWCTGATGVGTLLLHARDRGLANDLDFEPIVPSTIHHDIPRTLDGLARAAVSTVAAGTRSLGPSRCHGLAGTINLLLDVASTSEAFTLADLLAAFVSVAAHRGAATRPADRRAARPDERLPRGLERRPGHRVATGPTGHGGPPRRTLVVRRRAAVSRAQLSSGRTGSAPAADPTADSAARPARGVRRPDSSCGQPSSGTLGGTRTPNLLIRSAASVLRVVRADPR